MDRSLTGGHTTQPPDDEPFNIAAAITPLWLAWRRMPLLQVAAVALYLLMTALLIDRFLQDMGFFSGLALVFGLPYFILGAIEGRAANWLLRRQAARGKGGTSIVWPVVIAGLTAFALWRYAEGSHEREHERMYTMMMRSDLRNLVTAQEVWFSTHHRYTSALDSLQVQPSTGVTLTISSADSTGWSATTRHSLSEEVCGLWVGTAPPPISGASEGEPRCEAPR